MATNTLFADGVTEVQVTNGVVRFRLVQAPPQKDAKPEPAGTLVVPLGQVPAFARAFVDLVRQMEARAKASAGASGGGGQAAGAGSEAEAGGNGPVDLGSFRFSGGSSNGN